MSATSLVRQFREQPPVACVFAHIGQNESMLLAEFIERNSPNRLLKKSVVFARWARFSRWGHSSSGTIRIGPTAGEPVLVCRS